MISKVFIDMEKDRTLLKVVLTFTGILLIANLLTPEYKTNTRGTTYQQVPLYNLYNGGHVGRRSAGKSF